MLPCNFWAEVDTLTTRILTLLLPVLDLLDGHFAECRVTPLAAIHAELHALVAEAGYLAVCMRRSNSIFRVVWPAMGDPSSWEEHDHDAACEVVYEGSRDAALAIEDERTDVAASDDGEEEEEMTHVGDASDGEEGGEMADETDARLLVRRMAKVKLVLWPGLERYTKLLKGGYEGVDKFVVRKAVVAYYSGIASDEADAAERSPRLRKYVTSGREKERRAKMVRSVVRLLAWVGLLILLAICLLAGARLGEFLMRRFVYRHGHRRVSDSYSDNYGEVHSGFPHDSQVWEESSLARVSRDLQDGLLRLTGRLGVVR